MKFTSNPIYRFFFLFVSPLNGWKKLKNLGLKADIMAQKVFYPLVAIASLSVFFDKLNYDTPIEILLQQAIVTFVAFFFGYFIILFLSTIIMKKESAVKLQTDFGKIFIMVNLSSLTVLYSIYKIIPFIYPILVFTPIYTIYLIIKGCRFLRIPQEETVNTNILLVLMIIGIPIALNYIFTLILPTI